MNFLNIDQTGTIILDTTDNYDINYPDLSNCNNFQYNPLENVVYTWHWDINEPYPTTDQDFTIYVLDSTTGEVRNTLIIDNSRIQNTFGTEYGLRGVSGFAPLHPDFWQYGYKYAVLIHLNDSSHSTTPLVFGVILINSDGSDYTITKSWRIPANFSIPDNSKRIGRIFVNKNLHYTSADIYQIIAALDINNEAYFWNFINNTSIYNLTYDPQLYIGSIIGSAKRSDITNELIYSYSSSVKFNSGRNIGRIDLNSVPIYGFVLQDTSNGFHPIIVHKYNNKITIGNEEDGVEYDITTDSTLSTQAVRIAWISTSNLFIIREDSTQMEVYDLTDFSGQNKGGSISVKQYVTLPGIVKYDVYHFDPNGILWYNLNYPEYYYQKLPKISAV